MKPVDGSSAGKLRHSLSIDIQVLRGISVVMVVLYHAFPQQVPYGYLGVDVFFVISGYVITGMLSQQSGGGRALVDFYTRRAWRLLPSAYIVFLASVVCAGFILASSEFLSLWEQLLGALSFTANMVLWKQAGYFDVSASLKTLLHTWSLSVEEQFYLFWPVIFLTGLRNWRFPLVVIATVGSFFLYLLTFKDHANAAFYFLPTRGWQLGLGGMVFFLAKSALVICVLNLIRFQKLVWSLLFTGLVILLSPWSIVPVSYLVIAITFYAALLVLLSGSSQPSLYLGHRPLAYVGDISYVLYLVHWPVFSLAHNVFVRGLGATATFGLILVSLFAAVALHHTVETPARHIKWGARKTLLTFTGGALFIVAVASIFLSQKDVETYAAIRAENFGLSEQCDFYEDFSAISPCVRESSGLRVLVWGNSFAMHLVPGITATTDWTVVQATKGVCSPFAKVAPIYLAGGISQRSWSERCLNFNAL